MAWLGLMPLRPMPIFSFLLKKLSPVVLCCAASMYFGNAAYMHLSVAFIQILKAFTPAITLLLAAAFGIESLRPTLLMSVLLIALGTG